MKRIFKALCSRNGLFKRQDMKKIIEEIVFPKNDIGKEKRIKLKKKSYCQKTILNKCILIEDEEIIFWK